MTWDIDWPFCTSLQTVLVCSVSVGSCLHRPSVSVRRHGSPSLCQARPRHAACTHSAVAQSASPIWLSQPEEADHARGLSETRCCSDTAPEGNKRHNHSPSMTKFHAISSSLRLMHWPLKMHGWHVQQLMKFLIYRSSPQKVQSSPFHLHDPPVSVPWYGNFTIISTSHLILSGTGQPRLSLKKRCRVCAVLCANWKIHF